MQRTIGIWLLLLGLISLGLVSRTSADINRDDIRGTLQSLIYSYNQLDNKLERHEHRERAFSEIMKKAMQVLQKGQKNLEPLNGMFQRLDDRVGQIESLLIGQETKYENTLELIFKWMREHDDNYKGSQLPLHINAVAEPAAPAIPPEFIKQQEMANQELLTQIKKLSANIEKLLDTSKYASEKIEVAFRSMPATAEMLTKIEDKLVSYSVAPPPAVMEAPDNSVFENKVFAKFDDIANGIATLCDTPKEQTDGLTTADREFIHSLTNETLNALEVIKLDTLRASDNALATTTLRIKESEQNLETNIDRILGGVAKSGDIIEKFQKEINNSYSKLNEALDIFNKFNNILMANSEYVLDTQRKVEFGTIQIVQKISDLLDKQREEITSLVKERFDNVDDSIVSNQIEAMQNLSSTIETEITYVYHQMEIMNAEISDTKSLMNIMHGTNDMFINGTLTSMISMSGKVEDVKGRMLDMDSNLNYLLGKLSLMSQEFVNIKSGLAESIEQLRRTFQTMQEKMPTHANAGQHNNAKNEYETEVNLLQKRQTS